MIEVRCTKSQLNRNMWAVTSIISFKLVVSTQYDTMGVWSSLTLCVALKCATKIAAILNAILHMYGKAPFSVQSYYFDIFILRESFRLT